MSFKSPKWIHSWEKVHSAPVCRDCEERTHVQALTASVWYLYPEKPRNSGCHGNKPYGTHSLLWDALIRTHYILNRYTWTNTLNYPDTHTCRASGFQRAFFSSAGVEPRVFCGLFFSVRMTPPGSSRRQLTKFFNCQPTWKIEMI